MINTAAAVHATATEAVLRNHLRAATLGADAVMRDYTEESVLITHDATYRGLAEIRRFFDDSSFELSMTTDRGDVRRASSRARVPSSARHALSGTATPRSRLGTRSGACASVRPCRRTGDEVPTIFTDCSAHRRRLPRVRLRLWFVRGPSSPVGALRCPRARLVGTRRGKGPGGERGWEVARRRPPGALEGDVSQGGPPPSP